MTIQELTRTLLAYMAKGTDPDEHIALGVDGCGADIHMIKEGEDSEGNRCIYLITFS